MPIHKRNLLTHPYRLRERIALVSRRRKAGAFVALLGAAVAVSNNKTPTKGVNVRLATKVAAVGAVAVALTVTTASDASAQMCITDTDPEGWDTLHWGYAGMYEEGSGCSQPQAEAWLEAKQVECTDDGGEIRYSDHIYRVVETSTDRFKIRFLCLQDDEEEAGGESTADTIPDGRGPLDN